MHIISSNRIEVPVEIREAFEMAFIDSMRDTLAGVTGCTGRRSCVPRRTVCRICRPWSSTLATTFIDWIRSDSFKASHSDEQAPGLQAPNAIEQHTPIEVFKSLRTIRPGSLVQGALRGGRSLSRCRRYSP